jgi:2-dehydropantoate 2-reductase
MRLPPETVALAGEGDAAALGAFEAQRLAYTGRIAPEQRPSMGQDMLKGRRTEIEFLNGFVVREGAKVGIDCRANAVLTDIVRQVEKGDLAPDPAHITGLRLN